MDNINVLQHIIAKQRRRAIVGAALLIMFLFITLVISIVVGKANITVIQALQILFAKITGNTDILESIKASSISIVWDIRLPRILVGAAVGLGLAVAGVIFQAVLLNPLADSFTVGVSPGAAFGASLALFINIFFNVDFSIPLFAFFGAISALLGVLYLARTDGYASANNLIICGIIISSVLSAAISFIKSMAGEQVAAIVNWLIGSLAARTWEQAFISLPIILLLSIGCTLFADYLNILSLGDQEARNLGVNVSKVRNAFLIIAALITAISVSVSGIIGFVGLIVPHILRMAIGSDNRFLLPLSGLCGACLLSVADIFARALLQIEVPVGVLTTLLGGPFFFYIFKRRKNQVAK